MKRLTLEELKAQKSVAVKLEAIKGGLADGCHVEEKPEPSLWDSVTSLLDSMISSNRRVWDARYGN
jgi:hypothetical protein